MTFCGNPLLRSVSGVKRTCAGAAHVSTFDPKQTSVVALHLSAFGRKVKIGDKFAVMAASPREP